MKFWRFIKRKYWRLAEEVYAYNGQYREALYCLERGKELR